MSESRSLRITDPKLETWVNEHIQKGELNPIMNRLLLRYKQEQEQEYVENQREEKTERKIIIFQGIAFLSIAAFFIVFACSRFNDAFSIIATFLMILSGILLCIYVLIASIKRKETGVTN